MHRLSAGLTGALLVGLGSAKATAHHSFAMYDQDEERTLTGSLTRFIPGANHAQLLFELRDADGEPVLGDDGQPVLWGVELGPAATIARQGVTVDDFPLGTVIAVTLNPLRDGRNFGAQSRGTPLVKCGTSVPEGGCTPETGETFLAGGGS